MPEVAGALTLDVYRAAAELRTALRTFSRRSEQLAREEGLTPQQYMLLLMIKGAPDGSERSTVTALAERLYVRPSTLMSRFARAGLPSPKNYLSAVRLLHAAYLFESAGLSVADVAYRLEYSSPQSFGRHLRAMLGVTALEFRRRYPFTVALERFIELMVEPYRAVWRDFHPVAGVQLGG